MDIEQRIMVLIAAKNPSCIYLGKDEMRQLKRDARPWRRAIESDSSDQPERLTFSGVEIVEVKRRNYIRAHKE